MQKVTPEEVKSELTGAIRKEGLAKLEESKKIRWIDKQSPAWQEIYVGAHWLDRKLETAEVNEREKSCRVISAINKAVRVGPYIGFAEAWNLFVVGEVSPMTQRMMAANEISSKLSAALLSFGKPVN